MPLHEYLEEKRRRNIETLNASGACHICGSTGRNSRGFSHFIDGEAAGGGSGAGCYSDCSMVPRPQLAAMRTCACFGQSPSDPDYWPYSLRVCDKCIEDDKGIGRIRNCGVCGTVACDENCGAELLECTDRAEWNNAGCLECRRLGDFSEIPLFRSPPPQNHGEPRITRVCAKCLEMSTPWVRYDFVCRRFRCETRLVPSDIAERKRFRTFGSSPLNLLPEDGLVAVVDFLSGDDLKALFLTCSAMCTVAERVAKEKVERVSGDFPSGPVVSAKRKDGLGQSKSWTYLSGKNDFRLRAPDDEKAWVGVYRWLEMIAKETFYFDFQMCGEGGDREAVNRFISSQGEKFTFGPVYSKAEETLVECNPSGYSIRGGTVLVLEAGGEGAPVAIARTSPLIVSSDTPLVSGIHCIICRIFCPGSGGARSNRDATSIKLGSVGLIRTGPAGTSWAQRADVNEAWLREDVVFGVRYNTSSRELVVHSNSHLTRASRFTTLRHVIAEADTGELRVALELATRSTNCALTLLSARYCEEAEWARFVEHTTDGSQPVAVDARADGAAAPFDHIEAMEALVAGEAEAGQAADLAQANAPLPDAAWVAAPQVNFAQVNAPQPVQGRMVRELMARRNRRRVRAENNDDGGDDVEEGFVRAAEGRRAVRRMPPLRINAQRMEHQAGVARAAGEERRPALDPARIIEVERRAAAAVARGPARRVVRALRPVPIRRGEPRVQQLRLRAMHETDGVVDIDEELAVGEFEGQVNEQQAHVGER